MALGNSVHYGLPFRAPLLSDNILNFNELFGNAYGTAPGLSSLLGGLRAATRVIYNGWEKQIKATGNVTRARLKK